MEIVVRAAVVFVFLWLVTRVLGKRELAEISAFELVVLVVMGDLVQQAVTQEDMSVTGAGLAVGTMALMTLGLSYLAFRFRRLHPFLNGRPVIVVRDGEVLQDAMRIERLPVDDVLEAAREQGIENLSEVRVGILEPDGRFSFVRSTGTDEQADAGEKRRVP